MYEYLQGEFTKITPTYIVVDCNGVGYNASISLTSYEILKSLKKGKVFTHLAVSENNQSLYGFAQEDERELFRALIGVSGVGPSTARMILSSQSTKDIVDAIVGGNISLLKTIKGIGPKTAQRLVIELQDKLGKMQNIDTSPEALSESIHLNQEALLALEALGFNKNKAAKAISSVLRDEPQISIESLIKKSLKIL